MAEYVFKPDQILSINVNESAETTVEWIDSEEHIITATLALTPEQIIELLQNLRP